MNNALFGLGLMTALMVSQGISFGYQLEEKGEELLKLRFSPVTLFLFYVGSLMLAPEMMRRINPTYLGYAAATVCAGLILVAASAFLTVLAFRAGDRFLFGPGSAKTGTKVPRK